jgi:hypothetical protein
MGKDGPSDESMEIGYISKAMMILITVMIVVIFSVIIITQMNNYKNQIKQLNNQLITSFENFEEVNEALKYQRGLVTFRDEEILKLKQTINDIKNSDDLLVRDIHMYIKTRYTTTATIVAKTVAENVVKISKEENISPILITGIIEVESLFNPSAISKKGARGLMQVMPEWIPKFEHLNTNSDLHDIDKNILAGIGVLKIHIDEENGNVAKGLYRYVGKDKTYADKVYNAMGRFVSFRSIIDDSTKSTEEEIETNDTNDKPAEQDNQQSVDEPKL